VQKLCKGVVPPSEGTDEEEKKETDKETGAKDTDAPKSEN